MEKTMKRKIEITNKWEDTLVMYLQIFNSLNEEGKKSAIAEMRRVGKYLDNQNKGK
jgi:hypothetical protein